MWFCLKTQQREEPEHEDPAAQEVPSDLLISAVAWMHCGAVRKASLRMRVSAHVHQNWHLVWKRRLLSRVQREIPSSFPLVFRAILLLAIRDTDNQELNSKKKR